MAAPQVTAALDQVRPDDQEQTRKKASRAGRQDRNRESFHLIADDVISAPDKPNPRTVIRGEG